MNPRVTVCVAVNKTQNGHKRRIFYGTKGNFKGCRQTNKLEMKIHAKVLLKFYRVYAKKYFMAMRVLMKSFFIAFRPQMIF